MRTESSDRGSTRSSEVPTQQSGAPGREPQLRRLADRALRRALRTNGSGGPDEEEVREALRQLCDVARERGLRAEQLLVVLKESWRGLPETRLVMRRDTTHVLGRVISMCVVAYYAPRRGDG